MKMEIDGIQDKAAIPKNFAFGVKDEREHIRLGDNRNPAIRWSALPEGTRSLVLICTDPDAPSDATDVNQEGREVPADLPRVPFHHWVMVDIDPDIGEIPEGSCSDGVTAGGKNQPGGPGGSRQGLNDYTAWFDGDSDMAGQYFGYDGPCPPWNDALPHRYRFRLIATALERCPVDVPFRVPDVEAAIRGHVLGEASITGLYSLNPKVTV
jgi:Raf kinase inhibitor-like YbhB/YbcL family protein